MKDYLPDCVPLSRYLKLFDGSFDLQGELVKPEHFVLNSEYLATLLIVVPLALINDWHSKYESLCDMIVPR